jgi:hypothetical protein
MLPLDGDFSILLLILILLVLLPCRRPFSSLKFQICDPVAPSRVRSPREPERLSFLSRGQRPRNHARKNARPERANQITALRSRAFQSPPNIVTADSSYLSNVTSRDHESHQDHRTKKSAGPPVSRRIPRHSIRGHLEGCNERLAIRVFLLSDHCEHCRDLGRFACCYMESRDATLIRAIISYDGGFHMSLFKWCLKDLVLAVTLQNSCSLVSISG